MLFRSDAVCKYAISVLMEQMIRMDTCRNWTPEERGCIAEMYFSYVNYLCIEYKRIVSRWHRVQYYQMNNVHQDDSSFTTSEITPFISGDYIQLVYIMFFWVMKNFTHQTLTDLIRRTNQSLLKTILMIIKNGLALTELIINNKTCILGDISELLMHSREELVDGKDLGHYAYTITMQLSGDASIGNETIIDNINLVALEIVDTIFKLYSTRDDLPMVSTLFDVLGKSLFNTCMTNTYYPLFLSYIRYIIREKTEFLFQSNSILAFNIVNGLICLCTHNSPSLRQEAIATLYLFTKKDYERNNQSTRITQIHIISSLFNLHLHSKDVIGTVKDESMDDYIKDSIRLLEDWAKEDFSTKKDAKKDNEEVLDVSSRAASELAKWNTFKRDKRMLVVSSVGKEIASVGKRRCVLRALEYMKELWTDDSDITKEVGQLIDRVLPLVQQEDKSFTLEHQANELANQWMLKMKEAVSLITRECVEEKALVETEKELGTLTQHIIDIIKQIEELGTSYQLSANSLSGAMKALSAITCSRVRSIHSEKTTDTQSQDQTAEFVKKQEVYRKQTADMYQSIRDKTKEISNILEAAQYMLQQYKQMETVINQSHKEMKEEDVRHNGFGGWESEFSQWESIIPKVVNLINKLIEIQTVLENYSKNEVETKEDTYAELAASEQLIKICVWCVEVEGIVQFPMICREELPERMITSNELMKQYTSIEKMIQFVKTEYGGIESKPEKKYLFEPLYKEYIERDNWKSLLARKIQEMQDIHQKEIERKGREEEYKKLLNRIIQTVQMGDDYGEEVTRLVEQILDLEKTDESIMNCVDENTFALLQTLREIGRASCRERV